MARSMDEHKETQTSSPTSVGSKSSKLSDDANLKSEQSLSELKCTSYGIFVTQ